MHTLMCKQVTPLVGIGATPVASAAMDAIRVKSMTTETSGGINPAHLIIEIMTGSQIIHVLKWLKSHSTLTKIISVARMQNEFLLFRLLQ